MDEEERNFSSLVLLLLRVGTPCLRAFFKKEWDSTTRSARPWNDSTQNGADLQRIFKPLSYERSKVLSGKSSTWDLSLVIRILLHSRPPFVSRPNLVAALETLRDLRNKLCHATAPRLEAREFGGVWTDACNALSLFGAKTSDFDKVKKDVRRDGRFVMPELKGCASQERDIMSLLQSINTKQEKLLEGQHRILEGQEELRERRKTTLENMPTIEGQPHEKEDGQRVPSQSQRTTLELPPNLANQAKVEEGQSNCDKYVTYYYVTAWDSSHIAVGDKAALTTIDSASATRKRPADQTADATRQRTAKDFTCKLKTSIKQQTDNLLTYKGRKIRTDDIFTNMTIQRNPQRFVQTEQAEGRHRTTEYKVTPNTTLLKKCSEMFISEKQDSQSKVSDPYPNFILLIGKAGIGKSLFCRKIVRDWADDKLFDDEEGIPRPDFQFAFLLTFRQLNYLGDKEAFTLKDILKHSSILDDHSVIDDDVFLILCENPEKVLLILDGYDEYAHKSNIVYFEENYQNDPKGRFPVPAWIAKLLKGKIWKNSVVLVTSRPGKASSLAQKVIFDANVEIKGFSSLQVLDYVRKYFKHDERMKNALLDHIRGNENILRFGHIPVMCYFMCCYMEWHITKAKMTRLPDNRTDLYHRVIKVFIKEHHADLKSKRREITENEVQEIMDRLAEVAVKLTENKKFLFCEDDMRKVGASEEDIACLKASGLLDCWPTFLKRSSDPFSEVVSLEYTFTHLTVQEYLSAFCYVKMKTIPDKDKTTDLTLAFVVEMLPRKRDEKLLKKLLKAIQPEDEEDDKNRLLTLQCLQGFGDKEFAKKKIAKQYEKFCNQNGWIVFSSVTDMDCLSIAYLFAIIKSLKEESDRQIFKKHFIVNTLFIFKSSLATSGVRLICDSLSSSTVTELQLHSCCLDDSHCIQIMKGLRHSNVTNLNLSYNHITGEDITGICQALVHGSCHLKRVNLYGNSLTQERKRLLRQRLRKQKPGITLALDIDEFQAV